MLIYLDLESQVFDRKLGNFALELRKFWPKIINTNSYI